MTDPNQDDKPADASALLRMVDMSIPLPYLLGAFVVAMGTLISMYYQLQSVSESMKSLQISVQSGNASTTLLAGEQSLQKFRIENLENEVARLRGDAAPNQQRR